MEEKEKIEEWKSACSSIGVGEEKLF